MGFHFTFARCLRQICSLVRNPNIQYVFVALSEAEYCNLGEIINSPDRMFIGPMKLKYWLPHRLKNCTSVATYNLTLGLRGLLPDLLAVGGTLDRLERRCSSARRYL